MSDVSLKVDGLDKLLKALKRQQPSARVGILGSTASRGGGGPTNAEIGAVHEFGNSTHPVRSFLRMPLTTFLGKQVEKSGMFSKDIADEMIKKQSVVPVLEKVAVIAEGIVLEAFDTGGFGTWAPWAPGYMNNGGQLLVDTHQLRDSITSEVKDA